VCAESSQVKTTLSPGLAVALFGEKLKDEELDDTLMLTVAAAASAAKALRLRMLESMAAWSRMRIEPQLVGGRGLYEIVNAAPRPRGVRTVGRKAVR